MRNSRNGNGRSSRSSRQFPDQNQYGNDYRNQDSESHRGDYGNTYDRGRDQDYDYDRSGSRNQNFGNDYDRGSREDFGNNSYTDNEGYQQDTYRGSVNRYTRGGYDQDFDRNSGRGQSERWPQSQENWRNQRGSSNYGNSGGMSQGYGNEGRGGSEGYGSGYGRSFGNSGSRYEESSQYGDRGYSSFDQNQNRGQSGQRQSWGDSGDSMRGKGPKGYRRSDERIQEELNDRLTDDDALDASSIEVTVKSGEVTLSGTVQKRQDKRRAEDIAESVSGVNNVENKIRVSSDSEKGNEGRSEGREAQESDRSKVNQGQNKNKSHQNAEV